MLHKVGILPTVMKYCLIVSKLKPTFINKSTPGKQIHGILPTVMKYCLIVSKLKSTLINKSTPGKQNDDTKCK
jgi:hypothetical protein